MGRSALVRTAGLAFALSGWGCDALDDFEETIVDEVVVPASTGIDRPFSVDYEGSLSDLDLSSSRGFREAGVSPGDVDSIRLRRGTIAVDLGTPQLNDLARYIASAELYVRSDSRERALVARLVPPPPSAPSVQLAVEDLELKPFATDTGMRFDLDLQLTTQPALVLRIITTLTLAIDIDLLGV